MKIVVARKLAGPSIGVSMSGTPDIRTTNPSDILALRLRGVALRRLERAVEFISRSSKRVLMARLILSARDIRILEGLADGANSKELAQLIERSKGTVEAEIRALYRKLAARSRHHLVAQAFRL